MSIRRKAGDWVYLDKHTGFIIDPSDRPPIKAQIEPDGLSGDPRDEPPPCMICEDPGCQEWGNVIEEDGIPRYHVSECQMYDAPVQE